MRRTLFVFATLAAMISFSGCACTRPMGLIRGSCARTPKTCEKGGGDMLGWLRGRGSGTGHHGSGTMQAGPPTGAVAYPYYTTRGPRDFLADDPPSIGP